MPSLTVENYLKAILQAAIRAEGEWVSTGQLASALHVSPGTVTSMLKTLAESQLAEYRPYQGVKLTNSGRALGMRMVRRHRLIELFLVETLGLSWDEVHEEAEHMEHAVSDSLVDRIDAFLGHPEADPHGDPIPTAEGTMRGCNEATVSLANCPGKTQFTVVRVLTQDADFLRYLTEQGLELGAVGEVRLRDTEAGIVTVQLGEKLLPLGDTAAENILVQTADDAADVSR
ncbi:MAG: metal-dependent transcriptional regulator [Planctomycetaceae bacterium]